MYKQNTGFIDLRQQSCKIQKYMSHSKLVVIKNAMHFIFVEAMNELFSVINTFYDDYGLIDNSIPYEVNINKVCWNIKLFVVQTIFVSFQKRMVD